MTAENSTKRCSICKQAKSVSDFHKNKNMFGGLRPDCKTCRKNGSTTYYQKNRERVLRNVAKRAALNKQQIASYSKQWRNANQRKLQTDKHEYYIKNCEAHANRRRKYSRLHPEQGKASLQKRRALYRSAQGTFTALQWLAKCQYFGWRCYLCGAPLTKLIAQPEHRKPLSRGGSNWIANIAPACKRCNASKSTKTEQEYYDYICFQKQPT